MPEVKPTTSPFGRHKYPCVAGICGDPGTGKSLMIGQAVVGRGFVIGPPGGMKPVGEVYGVRFPAALEVPCSTLAEATQLVLDMKAAFVRAGKADKLVSVGVDDISVLLEGSYEAAKKRFSAKRTFALWDHLKREVFSFGHTLRHCGLYAFISGHLRPPSTDNDTGLFYKGGPKTPGRAITPTIPHICDIFGRTVMEDTMPGWWKGAIHCQNHHPMYHEKDRHGVSQSPILPPSLPEILRAAGYPYPRHPDLLWQENWVAAASTKILEGATRADMLGKVEETLQAEGRPEELIYWTLRDIDARVLLRRARERRLLANYY